MKIGGSIHPTPVVPPATGSSPTPEPQTRATESLPLAGPTFPKGRVASPPLVVDAGRVKIELRPDDVAKVVDKLNETVRIFSQNLRFEVSKGNEVKVLVVDSESGEVLRSIPPETAAEALNRMAEVLGVFLDKRV